MEAVSGEGRMLPLAEPTWSEFLPDGEELFSYLLKMNVPVYFKVSKKRYFVFGRLEQLPPMGEAQRNRMREISWIAAAEEELDDAKFHCEKVQEGPAYLRLDNESLEEFSHSRSSNLPRFSGWGLIPARTYRETGRDLRERPIMEQVEITAVSDLVKIEFDEAFVINKGAWDEARVAGKQVGAVDPLMLLEQLKVQREDLLIDRVDFDKLKHEAQDDFEPVSYPFEHEERMPALFWMFQAAHKFNVKAKSKEDDEELGNWLKARGPGAYPQRTIRTAKKFVWLRLDRKKGRKKSSKFNLGAIDKVIREGFEKKYSFDLVSEGFSLILAIATYWNDRKLHNPRVPRVGLAQMLIAHGFAGAEVGDLVHLIDGEPINDVEERELKSLVDKAQWREIRDKEVREGRSRRPEAQGSGREVKQKKGAN